MTNANMQVGLTGQGRLTTRSSRRATHAAARPESDLVPMNTEQRLITTARAYVRIIEVADLLLSRNPVWTERLLLQLVRAL